MTENGEKPKRTRKVKEIVEILPEPKYEPNWEILDKILHSVSYCFDVETNTKKPIGFKGAKYGLSYLTDITVISLAARVDGVIISEALVAPFSADEIEYIKKLILGDGIFVAHNAVFDIRAISKLINGMYPINIWDTMVMQRTIAPEMQYPQNQTHGRFDLVSVARSWKIEIPPHMLETKKKRGKLHTIPMVDVISYAKLDVETTLRVYYSQRDYVDNYSSIPGRKPSLEQLQELVDYARRAMREYGRMTAEGININREYLGKRISELTALYSEKEQCLKNYGLEKPTSPKVAIRWLYEQKHLPYPEFNISSPAFTTKGKQRLAIIAAHGGNVASEIKIDDLSTSSKYLETLISEIENETAPKIGDLTLDEIKCLSDFMLIKARLSSCETLRIHSAVDSKIHSLVTIGTETTRRRSGEPQLQNIVMNEKAQSIAGDLAGVFTGRDGYTLCELDYSNCESWWAALLGGDNELSKVLSQGDMHAQLAKKYFGEKWTKAQEAGDDAALAKMRFDGKSLTFGDAYGMGAEKLAAKLHISVTDAKRMKQNRRNAFPDMFRVWELAKEKAETTSQVNLWTGQTVVIKDKAYRAFNYLCQGGTAQQTLRAVVQISETFRKENMKSRVVTDMHDAIILEVKAEESEKAIEIATTIMSNIVPDNLLNRANPPIQFVAKFDAEHNKVKWGKGQPEMKVKDVVNQAAQTRRLGENDNGRKERLALLEKERYHLQCKLEKRFKTHLPMANPDTPDKIIIGPEIEVDLENYAKIPLAWLECPEDITLELINLSHDKLRHLAEQRQDVFVTTANQLAQIMRQIEKLS